MIGTEDFTLTEEPQIHCAGKRRQLFFLKITIPIIIIGLLFIAFKSRSQSTSDPLDGDMEEASLGLSNLIEKTPVDKKWSTLVTSTHSANPGLRYAAIDAISSLRTPDAVRLLEDALHDSASHVRQRAIESLPNVD